MDDFDAVLAELTAALGAPARAVKGLMQPRRPKDRRQTQVAQERRAAFGKEIAGYVRRVDPRLTSYRDAFDPEQNEGIPPYAVGNRRARASNPKTSENINAVIDWLPFTPAILASAANNDRPGDVETLLAMSLAPAAGKVARGARAVNTLAAGARGLPRQTAIAGALPVAAGATLTATDKASADEAGDAYRQQIAGKIKQLETDYGELSGLVSLIDAAQTPEQVADLQRRLIARGYDLGATGADGRDGPKTRAAIGAAGQDIRQKRDRIREQIDAAIAEQGSYRSRGEAEDAEEDMLTSALYGIGLGGTAAAVTTAALAGKNRAARNALVGLAQDARKAVQVPGRIHGTAAGDDAAGLVNEAYRMSGGRMPFVRERGLPAVKKVGRSGKPVPDTDLFGKSSHSWADYLPYAVGAEGAVMTGLGYSDVLPPADAEIARNIGRGSLGFALGMKGGRTVGNTLLKSPAGSDLATINALRARIEREAAQANPGIGQQVGDRIKRSLGFGPRNVANRETERLAELARIPYAEEDLLPAARVMALGRQEADGMIDTHRMTQRVADAERGSLRAQSRVRMTDMDVERRELMAQARNDDLADAQALRSLMAKREAAQTRQELAQITDEIARIGEQRRLRAAQVRREIAALRQPPAPTGASGQTGGPPPPSTPGGPPLPGPESRLPQAPPGQTAPTPASSSMPPAGPGPAGGGSPRSASRYSGSVRDKAQRVLYGEMDAADKTLPPGARREAWPGPTDEVRLIQQMDAKINMPKERFDLSQLTQRLSNSVAAMRFLRQQGIDPLTAQGQAVLRRLADNKDSTMIGTLLGILAAEEATRQGGSPSAGAF